MKENDLILKSNIFCEASFSKFAFIKRLPNGKYRVLSESGKNLGTYDTKNKAKARLRQIEMFKHINKKASAEIDLKDIEELTYSAIMRKLVKDNNHEIINLFQKIFKDNFDEEYLNNNEKPQYKSLLKTLIEINENYPIILSKKLLKGFKK